MSLVETLVGVAAGSILGFVSGFASSVLAQNRTLKLQRSEEVKERVYSPLFDEVADALQRIGEGSHPPLDEWNRVSKVEHLGYLISGQLREDLRRFYGSTYDTLNRKSDACTNHWPALVQADVSERLQGRAQQDPEPGIFELGRAVGWNLHSGFIPEHQMPRYSQVYERFRSISPGFTHATLREYFDWWKKKTRDDPVIVEYLEARNKTLREAESLRQELGRKLEANSANTKVSPPSPSQARDTSSRRPWRRALRRVTKLFLLSGGLFSVVGLSRYFDKVWQDSAPTTPNPLDANWMIALTIAITTGAIILGLFSALAPAAFKVISKMLGMDENP